MRPQCLIEVVGQEKIKERLTISIKSAKTDGGTLAHTLFLGSPGCGKTSLAYAAAIEMGSEAIIVNCATIGSVKEILPYVMKPEKGDILFLDEIHCLSKKLQEVLYTVLEDQYISLASKEEIVKINLPNYTVFAATTDEGLISKPLRSRFQHIEYLEPYDTSHMTTLVHTLAAKFQLKFTKDAWFAVAHRVKCNPRYCVNTMQWLQEYGKAKNLTHFNEIDITKALLLKGIDRYGFNLQDRNYLRLLRKFDEPVGIKTISATMSVPVLTIENYIEPYLFQIGVVQKTAKGRIIVK